jgi:hypothetical protein
LNGSGSATYQTASLAVASHMITASYGGDAIDVASTSTPLTQMVNAANFTITANPTGQTIIDGQTATFTLTITPEGSFTTPLTFSCSNLPSLANCAFSAASVTPDGNAVTAKLTVSTVAETSVGAPIVPETPSSRPGPLFASVAIVLGLLSGLVLFDEKRSKNFRKGVAFASLMLLVVGAMAACAGNGSTASKAFTPKGTSQLQVTASSDASGGNVSHSTTLTLTVQ